MNHDFLIRTTNRIAVYACATLIYCIFIFITIKIFDMKIFEERITEIFSRSLQGIFCILGGAMILNIMSNLSKISEGIFSRQATSPEAPKPARSRLMFWLIPLTFLVIFAVLFAGNELSTQRKKDYLIRSAAQLISENKQAIAALSNYKFSSAYIIKAETTLEFIEKIDNNFQEITMIIPDTIDGKSLFLAFGKSNNWNEEQSPKMASFIFSASQDERAYLQHVFSTKDMSYKFHSESEKYQLYFPIEISGKKAVLYFSENQRYGKL